MSVELMAKCARCGDMVPFEHYPNTSFYSVPGIAFGRLDSKGHIESLTSGATVLCNKCYSQVWRLVFEPGKEDADA